MSNTTEANASDMDPEQYIIFQVESTGPGEEDFRFAPAAARGPLQARVNVETLTRAQVSDERRRPGLVAAAALFDQLHEGAASPFTHVLLVKAQPAQSTQVTDDKPLLFKDKFSTIVEVNVTYMLIATEDSRVVRAGTATAIAAAHGDLGSEIRFHTTTPVVGVGEEDSDRTDERNRWFQ